MRKELPVLALNKALHPHATLLIAPNLTVPPGTGGTWEPWYKVRAMGKASCHFISVSPRIHHTQSAELQTLQRCLGLEDGYPSPCTSEHRLSDVSASDLCRHS